MTTPRRPSKGTDPALQTHDWRTRIRAYWKARREPCARCGKEIDYAAARYLPGTRKVNPWSLVVGHVVGRHEARRLGWSEAQVNALSNTQPEHARCSDRSGARYGNELRGNRRRLDTSRHW